MSLDFFNDEYVLASIKKECVWIFSAELWERVNHDRRVDIFSSAEYLPAMLKWWETHYLSECNVYWDGTSEKQTYLDPIGVLRVHSLTCKGRLVEGCHRLLVMVLMGHGFFPVELQEMERAEELLDISWMSYWKVVEGTSKNATLRRVTPNGFDVEVPAEISLLSPADGLVSSDVFGAGYHLGSAPYFGGPVSRLELVQYITKCQFGPRSVMVDMVDEEQLGQRSEWMVVLWDKTCHGKSCFSVKARLHVTSACKKQCASLEKLLREELDCSILPRLELASHTLICYSKLFIVLAASREMASGIDIEAFESTTMPDTFVQFVWQLVIDLHVFKIQKKLNDIGIIMYSKAMDLAVADYSSSPSSSVTE